MKDLLVLAQQIYDELDNVEYGTWSEKFHKVIPEERTESDRKIFNKCRIYFDTELLQVGYGICWDQALYTYWRFKQEGLEKSVMPFAWILRKGEHEYLTHTTLLIKDKKGLYWLEHAFRKFEGLHGPFKDLQTYKDEVIRIYTCHGRYTADQLEFKDKPDFDKCISEGKKLTTERFFEIIFKHD